MLLQKDKNIFLESETTNKLPLSSNAQQKTCIHKVDDIMKEKEKFLDSISLAIIQSDKRSKQAFELSIKEVGDLYLEKLHICKDVFNEYSLEEQVDKMLKIRDELSKEDLSKHSAYQEKVREIIDKKFNLTLSQLKQEEEIKQDIEFLLHKCEFYLIDDDSYLENKFRKKLKMIIDQYGINVSESTIYKIISLGKEVSKHSREFTKDKLSYEFKSKREYNLKKFENLVFSTISVYHFGEIVNEVREKSKYNKFDKDFAIAVSKLINHTHVDLKSLEIEVNLFIRDCLFSTLSDSDLKYFKSKNYHKYIAQYLFDLCIAINEKCFPVTTEDICDLFNYQL
ncbi:hypothetical protein AB837_00612 [bacterium AB1]|nr:hypothetical protein AB837_00612 [bacterium AB1]